MKATLAAMIAFAVLAASTDACGNDKPATCPATEPPSVSVGGSCPSFAAPCDAEGQQCPYPTSCGVGTDTFVCENGCWRQSGYNDSCLGADAGGD